GKPLLNYGVVRCFHCFGCDRNWRRVDFTFPRAHKCEGPFVSVVRASFLLSLEEFEFALISQSVFHFFLQLYETSLCFFIGIVNYFYESQIIASVRQTTREVKSDFV